MTPKKYMTLYEATGSYGLHKVSSTRKIMSCLEKKLRATRDIEKVAEYPFRKGRSMPFSPFKRACVLSQFSLMEFYLSLYVLVSLTKDQELEASYRTSEYKATFHEWLQEFCDPGTLHRYTISDKKRIRTVVSLDDMVRNVHSFLQSHPEMTQDNLLISNILSRLGRIDPSYSKINDSQKKSKLHTVKKTKTKKSLPRLHCQSDFDTNISDVYDEDNYHSIYDDTIDEKEVECVDVDGIDEEAEDSRPPMNKENDDEEYSTHSWKEMYELDSLSDEEISDEDVISFNESFSDGFNGKGDKDSDSYTHKVGEDWDAISEIQTVISVNTFSENKEMMFSYKDALNVNRKSAPFTIKEKEADYTITSDGKTREADLDRTNENDLYSVYFDHDNAKLKGSQRRVQRALKGK